MKTFEIEVVYFQDAEEWRKQGSTEYFTIEAAHMVDALHTLALRFPPRYGSDICEVLIQEVGRKKIETDIPDPIREGDGWKAKEGKDIS
jgi:hypothetical protein